MPHRGKPRNTNYPVSLSCEGQTLQLKGACQKRLFLTFHAFRFCGDFVDSSDPSGFLAFALCFRLPWVPLSVLIIATAGDSAGALGQRPILSMRK
eukprot:4096707-Amphidinium_carterae.1